MLHTYLQKLQEVIFWKLRSLYLYKGFQKAMKYNELKVINNAGLWSY